MRNFLKLHGHKPQGPQNQYRNVKQFAAFGLVDWDQFTEGFIA